MVNNGSAILAISNLFKWGGPHLRIMREWMQHEFRNGDKVVWDSDDQLAGTHLTPKKMEQLAEDIKDALLKAVIDHLRTEETT